VQVQAWLWTGSPVTVIDNEPHLHFENRVEGMKISIKTTLIVRAGRESTFGRRMAHLSRSFGIVVLAVAAGASFWHIGWRRLRENALRIESLLIL
jgi:hypothetical protein